MAENEKSSAMKHILAVICLFIVLLLGAVGHLYFKCAEQDNIIKNNRKVYVYNLEEVLTKLDVQGNKKRFEDSIVKLNEELLEGEKKIKNIKKADVKADFSDVYLNSLRMKRDDLINDYQKSVKELDKNIKKTLVEIAKEKKAPAVFLKSAVAIQTPDVVDLTGEVVKRVKKNIKKD
jgi:transposase